MLRLGWLLFFHAEHAEAARIAIMEGSDALQLTNDSLAIVAGAKQCMFTLYMGGCQIQPSLRTLTITLGSCQPDGSGGSHNVEGSCLNGQTGSDGCPVVENCWVSVGHYQSQDCSGATDHSYSTSVANSGSALGGCSIGCIEGQHNPVESGCFGTLEPGPDCSESLIHAGWGCHDDVMWAKSTGIHEHPEWYHGLTASSSTEEFHRYASQLPLCSGHQRAPCALHQCAPPCYQSKSTCSVQLTMADQSVQSYGCYGSLGFESSLGVCTPDGRGGANIVSSRSATPYGPCPVGSGVIRVAHFPNSLCAGESDHSYSSFMDGQCVPNCCNEDASRCDLSCMARTSERTCQHVSADSDCAGQLRWAMTEGIRNHPDWYTGLTADSSLSDFQRYISGLPRCSDNGHTPPCYGASDPCPTPCS